MFLSLANVPQGGPTPFPNIWNNENKCVLKKTLTNQGLRQLYLTVSWDLRAKLNTPDGALVSL